MSASPRSILERCRLVATTYYGAPTLQHRFDPNELVAHAFGVRALARSLVGDANSADDVVQDACLAALTRPPTGGTPRRAWFIGVVRNLARTTRRRTARRERRERAAARAEVVSPAAQAAEEIETHQRLVAAVAALSDPYRAAVVMRYFDGIAVREIAARHGVPAATASTWIHRGLATLRARLAREDDDWRAALLPVLAAGRSPVPLIPVAGAVAMASKKASLAVVAVLLLLGGVFVVREAAPRTPALKEPDRTTATAPTTSTIAPRHRALAEPGGRTANTEPPIAPTATTPADAPSSTITPTAVPKLAVVGHVTGPDGSPFPGAAVHGGAQGHGPVLTTSGADGSFAFTFDAPSITISAMADGFCPSDDATIEGPAGDTTLRLWVRAGALEGTVRTPDGKPAARATVRVGEENHEPARSAGDRVLVRRTTNWTVDTDESGRFRFDALPAGGHHVLAAAHAASVWHGGVEIRVGETSHLDVNLAGGAVLTGVARLASGVVAGGIRISVQEFGGPRSAVTAADGSYRITNITSGPSTARADGGSSGYAEKGFRFGDSDETRWDLVLSSGATLRGRLVDESGAPLRGWQVRLGAPHPRTYFFGETKTDADGRYEFTQKDGGEFTIEFSERRGALAIVSRGGVRADGADLVVVATTRDRPASVVTGRILGPDCRPLADAYVQLVAADRRSQADARSGADGRFTIAGVPAGTYAMTAWTKELAILRCGTRAVAAAATLDVGDLVFDAPIRVTVRFPEFARDRVAYYVDDDGHDSQPYYAMAHYIGGRNWRGDDEILLPPGSYTLRWSGNGVMGGESPIEIVAGGDVVISPPAVEASAHPMAFDPPAGDVAPKVVYVLVRDSAGRMVWEAPIGPDADGSFAGFPFLVAGTYTVEARSDTERTARQAVKIEGTGGPSAPAIRIALR